MNPEVVVVGSLNLDFVVPVPHLPAPGETIAGGQHFKTLGGKGANQAVAAARLGASVAMVGRVGDDAEGLDCVAGIERDGVDATFVVRDEDVPTGLALIAVDPQGENSIVVGQGSNARLCVADVRSAEALLRDARVTVAQLEIPMDSVHAAAASAGGTFILNPAPARPLPPEILRRVDVLTPNEIELAMLAGARVDSMRDVVEAARDIDGPDAVVVTLGAQGAVVVTPDRAVELPALRVEVVDTTAAGDAFCGALAEALARGEELVPAAEWAVAAAAVSVTRMGAQPSLPTREEVERLLAAGPEAASSEN
jgi:ribokinase